MKKLIDYEEDIYKCSRCGLCQSVCPVYKATLNECSVSKAKFNMLNGIIRGDLKLNKRIKSYMDLCTGCNACKDFCPSAIDAREIFIAVKNEYYRNNKISLTEKIENSYCLFKAALLCAKVCFGFYRFFKVEKLVRFFESFILKFGILGKRFLLLNSLASGSTSFPKQKTKNRTKKALYFEGCFNQYINPQTKNTVEKILACSEVELVKIDFECCGVSYLNDGNIDEFKKLIDINLSKIKEDFDYVLTDCASCNAVLKEYKNFDDSAVAKDFSDKVISFTDLIKDLNFESIKNITVTAHNPCHEHSDFIEIIKNIKNVTYVESKEFNKCCGFSGKFALKNPEISREISKNKAQHFIETNAEIILTTCPACILGINQGLIEENARLQGKMPEVMNLYAFIATYCKPI